MKRISLIALILFTASTLFAISGSKNVNKNMPQSDKAGLEQTVNQLFDTIKAANVEKIKAYYTADYTFAGPDGKIMGAEERLKLMTGAGGANTLQGVSEITVRTYGNTGVVTGIATTKNASGGTDQGRFLQAWTWQGGRWRLAASQVTRITQ